MSGLPEWLRIGTSSWSAPSWQGVFYPAGTQPVDYITHYAREFDTVEIDTTFYRIPSARMVDGWRERTPERFTFAAKMPQVITHEKFLEDCDQETGAFIKVMERLGDRLGPLLLQFRYFRKAEFPDADPFIDRLERYLPKLPAGRKFVVEVRNKHFVVPRLLDLLHRHGVALALIDHPWFYRIDELMRRPGILTADFVYIRWLGDRHGIERKIGHGGGGVTQRQVQPAHRHERAGQVGVLLVQLRLADGEGLLVQDQRLLPPPLARHQHCQGVASHRHVGV